jgi:hypothetical protein
MVAHFDIKGFPLWSVMGLTGKDSSESRATWAVLFIEAGLSSFALKRLVNLHDLVFRFGAMTGPMNVNASQTFCS